ncbi:hypothetical protein HYW35_02760 [Candidatus Saccharibacteria bacterium]|nr:hypothetical protein [Candidatus Saccharibacteria bacterium]
MKLPLDPKTVVEAPKPVVDKLAQHRDSAFGRFPLLFTLLGAFGLVATFYGFERIIDKITFFANHPFLLLGAGLLLLILTGSLYKKL